jgi:hypothetical protein
MRRFLKLVIGAAAIVIVAGFAFAAWRFYDRDPEISAADVRQTPELIARGKYLVTAADCAACHNIPGGRPFTGGLAFKLPFGTIYSTSQPTLRLALGLGAMTISSALCIRASRKTARISTPPFPIRRILGSAATTSSP